MNTFYAVLAGFGLDIIIGDPPNSPHFVKFIGWMITKLENFLRYLFPKTQKGELFSGTLLVSIMICFIPIIVWGVIAIATLLHPWLGFGVETLFCCQALAMKSLYTESGKVCKKLETKDLIGARKAVSMIVGRDTENLTFQGVTKATIETVAENTSDGVIAPLLFLAIGGAPLGFLYKTINTMDSMLGYKNDRYLYFGRTAAKLDDFANWIPARVSALLMIASAWILSLDGKGAWKIFLRDRFQHASPNSAQTESVCAGALGIQLAGDAWYFGKLHKKPTIGDELQSVGFKDIYRVNYMMICSSILCLIMCSIIRLINVFHMF